MPAQRAAPYQGADKHQNKYQNGSGFLNAWYKKLFLALVIIAAIVFAVRIILNPLALYFTRQTLAELPEYNGNAQGVSISIIPPGMSLTGVKITEDPSKPNEFSFSTEQIKLNIVGSKLLKGSLVANVGINHPKVTFVKEPAVPPKVVKPIHIPNIGALLKKAPPLRVNQIKVNEAEIIFIDATEKIQPRLWIHDMEVTIDNVATREKLTRDMPTTINADAVIQRSGRMRFTMNVNPWEKGLNFAGETELKGLALTDLGDFLKAKADLQPVRGTFDLFVSFKVEKNEITGGIKPILRHVDVAPKDSSFLNWLKSKVVDTAISLISGTPEAPQKEKIATIIPIKGTITEPNPQILPTVLGIIRNAFVEGISTGFSNIPPPTAEKKEGAAEQIIDALTPGGGPPKAQPQEGKEEKK